MTDPSTPPRRPHPLVVRLLRAVIPRQLYRLLRTAVMYVLTPTAYAVSRGYYRSVAQGAVVDATGKAAPWMTFPLVELLSTRSFTGRSVFEFGSGHSSVWWGARADRVLSLETDPGWTELVRTKAPSNVRIVDVPLEYDSQAEFAADVRAIAGADTFDVVVIDGGDRVKAIVTAPSLLTDDGVIIIDDLDLFRSEPAWVAALESLRDAGFGCIDFYGLAVSVPFTRSRRCTSIFFRDGSFITR